MPSVLSGVSKSSRNSRFSNARAASSGRSGPWRSMRRVAATALGGMRAAFRANAVARRMLRQGPDLPLDAALALENREFLLLFDTPDKTEGMRAFLDKRRPEFTGE